MGMNMQNMKGMWRMVESVIAVLLIMLFLASAGSVYFTAPDENGLTEAGYQLLKEMDSRGVLRPYAAAGNYAAINSGVQMPAYNHSVQICSLGGACTGEYPSSDNIVVSGYVIAGSETYAPLEVKLYVWW